MGFDDSHNTPAAGLVLGLGLISSPALMQHKYSNKSSDPAAQINYHDDPSLNLSLNCAENYHDAAKSVLVYDHQLYRQDSAASNCFSNVSVKRERELIIGSSTEEGQLIQRVITDFDQDDDDGSNYSRKKLRLTKLQSALLEESFNIHTTLNPKQKHDLARELKLRPRQVEVWFQNRRARTKLKQTEVDCEFLKKCCESLTDENRRLHKELQELKLAAQPLYMQLPATTLTMCPSCERVAAADTAAKGSFTVATKPHFYKHFNTPSAAC
ncbi:homeobox-leucine zipper protein HAT22-like [Henckelia pumila]|uniref:homeobox-leucine zipper protein HAT22-like n=1 Tax=Henckelia pumila TaxID=405737 RepID=UPI003C6DC3BE